MGQTASGVIPIYGQVGDARDTWVALETLWESGGSDGKLDTLMATVAWIPAAGDFAKGAHRIATKGSGQVAEEGGKSVLKGLDDFTTSPLDPNSSEQHGWMESWRSN